MYNRRKEIIDNVIKRNDCDMKKQITYIPHPVDTSQTLMPDSLICLSELLAKNVHENWSAARIADGWKYGPTRNDKLKTNPCLVPFDELSDEEKSYDRITAVETIKLIISLGYNIVCEQPP